jgi:hypothetical protein
LLLPVLSFGIILEKYKGNTAMDSNQITLRTFRPEDQAQILEIVTSNKVNQTYMLPDFETKEDAIPLFNRLMNLSNDSSRFVRCIDLDGTAIGFLNDVEVKGYQKHYVPSTPQLAADLGLNYRTNSYWFFELHGQYFANSYLDMNPLYRTDWITAGPDGIMTPVEVDDLTAQEGFAPVFLLNASIGKSWYIDSKYNFGFSLNLQNLTNHRAVRTGGYEGTRLADSKTMERYYKFDSKYFYMQGFNYMLNLYFRF